jgi:circadian clock protein KaiC
MDIAVRWPGILRRLYIGLAWSQFLTALLDQEAFMGSAQNTSTHSFLSSGVAGLDEVLNGGFTRDRLYLVEGAPGSGKTTLALQFLLEGVHIEEVIPSESILNPEEQYSIFHPSDVEMGTTTREILSAVESLRPTRVVLDSLSELQLLAPTTLLYRRQVLALKQFFASRSCTTIFLDDRTAGDNDLQTRSIAHGVITLERMSTDYGGIRRRLEVMKYRGIAFREGRHDYRIQHGGVIVYPRLIAAESREWSSQRQFGTGIAELDSMLGGGIEEGSSTLIAGPPGTGKSTLASQLAWACLAQGQRAAMFLFEESASNLLNRADKVGIGLRSHLATKALTLRQVDPAQMTPGEFISLVCQTVENGAKVVVIDSLNGFLQAMPSEKMLATHMHELLTYLGQRGVVTVLIGVQQGMLGGNMSTQVDASYIADNVLLLRYFEASGEVRQAISIFKKRGSGHERTIRRMSISTSGIEIGPVLRQFHGILTGVPKLVGDAEGKGADSD